MKFLLSVDACTCHKVVSDRAHIRINSNGLRPCALDLLFVKEVGWKEDLLASERCFAVCARGVLCTATCANSKILKPL